MHDPRRFAGPGVLLVLLGKPPAAPRLDIELWHVAVVLFVTISIVPRNGCNPLHVV